VGAQRPEEDIMGKVEAVEVEVQVHGVAFNTLDYGELDIFEDIVGMIPTSETEIEALPRVKFILAMGLISKMRTHPETTLEEIKRIPIGGIKLHGTDANVGEKEVEGN
jgi:hypothetical protein